MTAAEPSIREATRLIEPRVDDTLAHYAVTIVPTLPSSYPRQIGLACGEYNVRALLDAFDIEYEAEPEPLRRVRWFGLSFVTDLRDALVRHGVDSDVRHASELHDESRLALLRGHIDSHEPVILAIGNGHLSRTRDSAFARTLLGHYITIYGYDAERGVFFVYDPYLDGEPDEPLPAGNVERTAEEILRDWGGPIYYRWIGMDHVYMPVSSPSARR
jgi:hypothetical protein